MWVFPLGAGMVSAAFCGSLMTQWSERRRPNLLAWGLALGMFAVASLAAAIGMLAGWSEAWFRVYYLFGAILNVPVLALGTVYVLGPRPLGHACAAAVTAASALAVVAVLRTDLHASGLATGGIPRGADVVPSGVRLLARIYSFAGFFVVVGGALWSSYRLLRGGRPELRDLAIANLLIAGGTFVVALGSAFAFRGAGVPFSVGLLAGVCLMFWGFLKTRSRAPSAPRPQVPRGA